jgi:hypothetical protein
MGWATVIFRRIHKIAESDNKLHRVSLSVRPPLRMQKLGSHWPDFREILHYFSKILQN